MGVVFVKKTNIFLVRLLSISYALAQHRQSSDTDMLYKLFLCVCFQAIFLVYRNVRLYCKISMK